MNENELIEIFENATSVNEVCRKLYGNNYESSRKKVKKLFTQLNYNWDEHIEKIKDVKRKYCLNCGNELKKGQYKFCSKSCAASFNNKKRGLLSDETKTKISIGLQKYHNIENIMIKKSLLIDESILKKEPKYLHINNIILTEPLYCKNCGKELPLSKTDFCDKNCRKQYNNNEYILYIERWKNGEECGHTPCLKLDKKVRRYLFEKNNNKCQKCGWGEINPHTNKVPLQIHHIDGDCTNNSEENLELLCPNCHSLTENFGSTNRNSKRLFRKQKLYSEEK